MKLSSTLVAMVAVAAMALLAAATHTKADPALPCPTAPKCASSGSFIFLLDGSGSSTVNQFIQQVNSLKSRFCDLLPSNIGVMLYNGDGVKVLLKAQQWTYFQWQAELNAITYVVGQSCCKGNRPLAEAIAAARKHFSDQGINGDRSIVLLMNNLPVQNQGSSGWNYPAVSEARYYYQFVPQQATRAKRNKIRVVVQATNVNANINQQVINYVQGVFPDSDKGNKPGFYCRGVAFGITTCCLRKAFPIASTPFNKYVGTAWNPVPLCQTLAPGSGATASPTSSG